MSKKWPVVGVTLCFTDFDIGDGFLVVGFIFGLVEILSLLSNNISDLPLYIQQFDQIARRFKRKLKSNVKQFMNAPF